MANMTIPTSRDIYLELNGKKLAVVQGYSAKALRTSREVEAFGESEPVATVGGQTRYTLELSRLYATDEAIGDGVSFYELDDFSVVVCRPGKRIIYSHCRWSNIEELGKLGEQTVVISQKGFDRLHFVNAYPVSKSVYYPKFLDRDTKARDTYRKEIKKSKSYRDDIFVLDILREEMSNDDPRIQRILFE